MYRVFLADDEMWILFGLKKLIEKSGLPFQVIGEATNGVTTLEELEIKKPDVLFSDVCVRLSLKAGGAGGAG